MFALFAIFLKFDVTRRSGIPGDGVEYHNHDVYEEINLNIQDLTW